jgi:PAS domain S-box-containing protein
VHDLAAAEERWRLTIDNAPVGIALVSLEGQFMRVNDALCQMLGHTSEELHALTFQTITHPDDLEADLHLLAQVIAGEIPSYRMHKRYLHAEGHVIWASLSVGLVRNDDGKPLHFVSHVADLTEELAAAERIERVNRELSEQTARLERSNADLESFAMLVSHDLQAPLTTVRGYLEGLLEMYGDRLDDRASDWIGRADKAAARMSELVNSLLAFSRAGEATTESRTMVSLPALLADVCQDLQQVIAETGATVRLTSTDLPAVFAHPDRLRQIIQNLVQNSLKHRSPDRAPTCVIDVEERESAWLFSVTDNAVGVPQDQREQIFSMFSRLDGTAPGHGIGLAACRQVVERYGGRIWVEDNPQGPGSRFCFTIPR